MNPVDRCLDELARALPRLLPLRRRILAEAEDHLRQAAREHGPEAAVARFGPPAAFARSFAPLQADLWTRLAAAAVAALLALPLLLYPLVESGLPPAPWPSADAMPAHLEWKRDTMLAVLLVAAGALVAALPLLRRQVRAARAPLAVAVVALAAAGVLGTALAVQWADEVPGTPAWLQLLPPAQLALAAAPAALLVRAGLLRRTV